MATRKRLKFVDVEVPDKEELDIDSENNENDESNEGKEKKKMSKKKLIGGIVAGATVVGALVTGFVLGKKNYATSKDSDLDLEDIDDPELKEYIEINPVEGPTEDSAD